MIAQLICLHKSQHRVIFETRCTAPCTGIAAAGGMICNIIAINAAPPPAPATAVSAEVQSAATVRNTISNMVIIRFDFMVYWRTMQLYTAKLWPLRGSQWYKLYFDENLKQAGDKA
tara:strand:- start:226 stop:573 length:348 start_codon:yes stop_codon:yes gene_type:complete